MTREEAVELGRKYAQADKREPPTDAERLNLKRGGTSRGAWLLRYVPTPPDYTSLWYWIVDDATGELVESGAMKA